MSLPDLPQPNHPQFLQRVREVLHAFLKGTNRAITFSELQAAGLVSSTGGSVAPGPLIGTEPDLTAPPTPTGLTVTAGITRLIIEWDDPTYTAGHGHDRTIIYGATYSGTGPLPTFSSAVEIKSALGSVTDHTTPTGTQWHIWIKWQSKDGVQSASPAGGTNGVTATTGKVGTSDLTDLIITSQKIAAGAVDAFSKFAGGLEPVASVAALPNPVGYTGPKTVFLTTDNKLYRYTGSGWTAAVPTVDLTGQITTAQITDAAITQGKFSSGLEPVSIVSALPSPTGYTGPKSVFLTTDNKLYRYTGTAFTVAVPTVDLTGQITTTQITDNSVTTAKVAANAITAAQIAANTITSGQIAANTITGGNIAAGTIAASNIAANTITAAQIAAGTITSTQIAADTITGGNIAANTITASELAADSVTAGKIQAAAVVAGKIAANAIVAGDGAIANLAITNGLIANAAIDSAKIADLAVVTAKINDLAVTTAKIADANITSAKIGNAQITNAHINDLSAAKINAGTLDAARIAAGTITGSHIAATTITGGNIAASTITTGKILVGEVSVASGAFETAQTWSVALGSFASTASSITFTSSTILSLTTTGAPVKVVIAVMARAVTSNTTAYGSFGAGLTIDGTPAGLGNSSISIAHVNGALRQTITTIPLVWRGTLAAGSHTFAVGFSYQPIQSTGAASTMGASGSIELDISGVVEENKV